VAAGRVSDNGAYQGTRSNVEAALVGHRLAILEITPQHPELHRPAVARYAIVLGLGRPPPMIEVDLRDSTVGREPKADSRPEPLLVRARELELEFPLGLAPRHCRPPVVPGPEPELIFGVEPRLAC